MPQTALEGIAPSKTHRYFIMLKAGEFQIHVKSYIGYIAKGIYVHGGFETYADADTWLKEEKAYREDIFKLFKDIPNVVRA